MRIKVSLDSTWDLSKELSEKYGIDILPLYIVDGVNSYKDGIEITPLELYTKVKETKSLFSTSAIPVYDYVQYFKKTLFDYDAIIHITISSKISYCYQNANIAASEFKNIFIVDSLRLSGAVSILAILADDLVSLGLEPEKIYLEDFSKLIFS